MGQDDADGNNDVVVSDGDILNRKLSGNKDKSWVASNSTLPVSGASLKTSLLHCACKYGIYDLAKELVDRDQGSRVRSLVSYPDSSNKTVLDYMRANLKAGGFVNGGQSKQSLCAAVLLIRQLEALADVYGAEGRASPIQQSGAARSKRAAQKKNSESNTSPLQEGSKDFADITILVPLAVINEKLAADIKKTSDATSSDSVEAVAVSYGELF